MEKEYWSVISPHLGLLGLATLSIYAGSHCALPKVSRYQTQGSARRQDDEEEEVFEHVLDSGAAWLIPVFASVALFGLYLIMKYCGTEWINWFLRWYYSLLGVFAVWRTSTALLRWAFGENWETFHLFKATFTLEKNNNIMVSWRTPELIALPFAFAPSILWHINSCTPRSLESLIVNNVLAWSFSHNAIWILKVNSFKTGAILLSGLFFYDIWWVFGTKVISGTGVGVMEKVAVSLELPMLLRWPKSLSSTGLVQCSMLGLGDVVMPGVFIAQALRFDDHHHHTKEATKLQRTGFPKPYFRATLGAYVLGLIMTIVVMSAYKAAQPALLYLSPACILSFVITASIRGEFKEAWAWR